MHLAIRALCILICITLLYVLCVTNLIVKEQLGPHMFGTTNCSSSVMNVANCKHYVSDTTMHTRNYTEVSYTQHNQGEILRKGTYGVMTWLWAVLRHILSPHARFVAGNMCALHGTYWCPCIYCHLKGHKMCRHYAARFVAPDQCTIFGTYLR